MRKTGLICMLLGTALLLAALALFLANDKEDVAAGKAAVEVIPQLVERIQTQTAEEDLQPIPEWELPGYVLPENDQTPVSVMRELVVDGNGYIGFLSFPTLELELPVMGDWNYEKLKIAPCRYAGNISTEDLVIMAHNYQSHFGSINQLNLDDSIFFADVKGNLTEYAVVGKDVLAATAIEEMTAGEYDLVLFTCTYGGTSRVTVYCDQVKE